MVKHSQKEEIEEGVSSADENLILEEFDEENEVPKLTDVIAAKADNSNAPQRRRLTKNKDQPAPKAVPKRKKSESFKDEEEEPSEPEDLEESYKENEEEVQEADDQVVPELEQDRYLDPAKKKAPLDIPVKKLKRGEIDPKILEDECDELINEINFAIESDNEANRAGKPGLSKLRVKEKIINKLKGHVFSDHFLENDGLNILNRYISKLPDGSWPLSSVRQEILKTIFTMNPTVGQLKNSHLGGTLEVLLKNPKEFPENRKLIQQVKDKWSRIICDIPTEYTNLEQFENTYHQLPMSLKYTEEDLPQLGKRADGGFRGSGYNFVVRPASVYSQSAVRIRTEDQAQRDNMLMRLKRSHKHL